VSRKTSVCVCLSVGYTRISGVCISLLKDVSTETKKSISWLLFLGVSNVVSRIKNIQSVPNLLGQISGVSSSHKRKKKIYVIKQFLVQPPCSPDSILQVFYLRGDLMP